MTPKLLVRPACGLPRQQTIRMRLDEWPGPPGDLDDEDQQTSALLPLLVQALPIGFAIVLWLWVIPYTLAPLAVVFLACWVVLLREPPEDDGESGYN